MGSAMASQRSKDTSRLSSEYNKSTSEASESAGENTSQDSSLRVRLEMALHDLETGQANLDLERQRVSGTPVLLSILVFHRCSLTVILIGFSF